MFVQSVGSDFDGRGTIETYTLSLHNALPIFERLGEQRLFGAEVGVEPAGGQPTSAQNRRSEEHTSELQSHGDLVFRLLLEKKKHRLALRAPDRKRLVMGHNVWI